MDGSSQTSQKIDNFKKALLIPNGKGSEDSLFYAVCYAVSCMQTKKKQKKKVQMFN